VRAIDDPALIETTDVLGVDFGIVNIATDSAPSRRPSSSDGYSPHSG
jgi:hypothetical protein